MTTPTSYSSRHLISIVTWLVAFSFALIPMTLYAFRSYDTECDGCGEVHEERYVIAFMSVTWVCVVLAVWFGRNAENKNQTIALIVLSYVFIIMFYAHIYNSVFDSDDQGCSICEKNIKYGKEPEAADDSYWWKLGDKCSS